MDRAVKAALLIALVALAAPAGAGRGSDDWRLVSTQADRAKLHHWERAWQQALGKARTDRDAATVLAADPALFDPFAALDEPMPPAGSYRCRTIKLAGGPGIGALAAGAWGACRIEADGALARLARLDGDQRLTGRFYADAAHRAVFLGTLSLGDERRPAGYGHAAGRDLAGVVEHIGATRWRLAIPYPPFEATLELVDLVPAS